MRLAFHNFWYNCDNGSGRGVRFPATLFELWGDLLVVDSANDGYWVSLVGTATAGGR